MAKRILNEQRPASKVETAYTNYRLEVTRAIGGLGPENYGPQA